MKISTKYGTTDILKPQKSSIPNDWHCKKILSYTIICIIITGVVVYVNIKYDSISNEKSFALEEEDVVCTKEPAIKCMTDRQCCDRSGESNGYCWMDNCCVLATGTCYDKSDCCGEPNYSKCSEQGICCKQNGAKCADNSECCEGSCIGFISGQSRSGTCCNYIGDTDDGNCQNRNGETVCRLIGSQCKTHDQCCQNGKCENGICASQRSDYDIF